MLSFLDFENPYGSHIRPYNLANYLPNKKFDVIAVCGKGRDDLKNFSFVERKWVKFKANPAIRYSFGLLDTYNLIKKFKPDIIYAHGYTFGSITTTVMKLSKLKLLKKTPIVVDLHGSAAFEQKHNSPGSPSSLIFSLIERSSLVNANQIITASKEVRDFISSFYGIDPTKVATINNGVSVEDFYPLSKSTRMQLRAEANLQGKKVIVLVAPRESDKISDWGIQAVKIMYNAMSQLYETRKDIVLRIIGGGPVPKDSPPPNATYLSFVANLNSELNMADIAIVPYPEWLVCGGARNKVLEFFACQIPVISTKSGVFGIPEAEPFKNYIPITYRTYDVINKIILALDMDEDKLKKVTDNAFDLVAKKYDWKKSSQLLDNTFSSLKSKP